MRPRLRGHGGNNEQTIQNNWWTDWIIKIARFIFFIDEGKSKKFLLCNNYYNVINYYSKFFMIDTDKYIPGTTFEEISNVYYFDCEI